MKDDSMADPIGRLMSGLQEPAPVDRASLETLTRQTVARQEQLERTVKTLQESLDYLRVSVKYLVFDLEATRRENEHLRRLLREGGHAESD